MIPRIKKAIRKLRPRPRSDIHPNFNIDKSDLIDFLFKQTDPSPHSFADLGCVFAIDAAYTFYTLDRYEVTSSFLVDTDISPAVEQKRQKYPNLTAIRGNFGDPAVPEKIGQVDAIFLFDVLLHQVQPHWDEILEMYAPMTTWFAIHNPQYTASETTVRLLDLGRERYFENVPESPNHPVYRALFEHMYEPHPQHGRIWKDVHNVWQWGITDSDLRFRMDDLGFSQVFRRNCGRFGRLKNFDNFTYVFKNRSKS